MGNFTIPLKYGNSTRERVFCDNPNLNLHISGFLSFLLLNIHHFHYGFYLNFSCTYSEFKVKIDLNGVEQFPSVGLLN